ncbi:MAG: hypothetical protein FGF51_07610, partial [Candidatus Brockarchaeota archaeon]|nr:hypothetical protein [Candidatus Brockarchaeota archaeon]
NISRSANRDVLIAATALLHARGRVLSDDSHFGRVEGIKVLWLVAPEDGVTRGALTLGSPQLR